LDISLYFCRNLLPHTEIYDEAKVVEKFQHALLGQFLLPSAFQIEGIETKQFVTGKNIELLQNIHSFCFHSFSAT